jgi:hypothetical protein
MMIYASKLQAFNNKPLCLTLDVVVVVVVLRAVYY